MATLTVQGSGTIDGVLNSGLPNQDSGSSGDIVVGKDKTSGNVHRIALEFDLSDIPSGSVVNSATLTLWMDVPGSQRATTSATAQVFKLRRDWIETQATWNSYTTGNNWSTAGAGNTSTDRESTVVGSHTLTTGDGTGSQHDFTLTASEITSMLNSNNGFLIQASSENNNAYQFRSSESSTSAQRPKLVVNYSPGGGGFLINLL